MICGCNFKLLARGGYRCPFMLPEIASSRKLQKNFARSIEDSIKKGLFDGIFSSTASLRNSFVSRDLWGGILMEYIRNMYAKIDSISIRSEKEIKSWRARREISNETCFLFEELCPSPLLTRLFKGREKWEPPLSVPKTVRRAINFLR